MCIVLCNLSVHILDVFPKSLYGILCPTVFNKLCSLFFLLQPKAVSEIDLIMKECLIIVPGEI